GEGQGEGQGQVERRGQDAQVEEGPQAARLSRRVFPAGLKPSRRPCRYRRCLGVCPGPGPGRGVSNCPPAPRPKGAGTGPVGREATGGRGGGRLLPFQKPAAPPTISPEGPSGPGTVPDRRGPGERPTRLSPTTDRDEEFRVMAMWLRLRKTGVVT